MKTQILLSTMHQQDTDIVKKINANTDMIMVNQCQNNDITVSECEEFQIVKIDSDERGLSKSRNLALDNATADICILCDDDVVYKDGINEKIVEAFEKLPMADIIVFDYVYHKDSMTKLKSNIKKMGKTPFYKTYGSVQIAFKLSSIKENNIRFNEWFGTGSEYFNMGEDVVFLRECRKKKLKIYRYPLVIADVFFDKSSWFVGYNQKYFFDVGAQLAASYRWICHIYKYYYIYRLGRQSDLTKVQIISEINNGIKYYRKLMCDNEK